ncbi:MAG: pyruvate formate-lyase activating enzyme, partial [candidate division NC10 bacterium]|nr:pyruvate formate-lyase activating enzyme [candidate division NC10 bacterium]
VFQGGGHGMFYLKRPPGLSRLALIAVTGPHREMARKTRLPCHYPAPYGDMMMTGPAGLVMAAAARLS